MARWPVVGTSTLVFLAMFAAVPAGCSSRTATACSGRVFVENGTAPAAVGESLNASGLIDLDDMRGRPVVVNFWASWCAPCRQEAPILREAYEELSPTVGFLGIDIRDERAPAVAFMDEFDLNYPSMVDKEAAIAAAWGVSAPPATFVVSSDGKLVARLIGAITRDDIQCMLSLAD